MTTVKGYYISVDCPFIAMPYDCSKGVLYFSWLPLYCYALWLQQRGIIFQLTAPLLLCLMTTAKGYYKPSLTEFCRTLIPALNCKNHISQQGCHIARSVTNLIAILVTIGCYSSLWPRAITFERSQRGYLWEPAATIDKSKVANILTSLFVSEQQYY